MIKPEVHLTLPLVYEWVYRRVERIGIMCEDRIPTPAIVALAEKEANEWLSEEMAFAEVDRELAF